MIVNYYISVLNKIGPWVFINVRGIDFLESFYAFFGIHDVVLIFFGIVIYTKSFRSNKIIRRIVLFLFIILFIYFVPLFSATFEIQRLLYFKEVNGDVFDGFNFLYAWFRFPMYWLVTICIIYFNYYKDKKSELKNT